MRGRRLPQYKRELAEIEKRAQWLRDQIAHLEAIEGSGNRAREVSVRERMLDLFTKFPGTPLAPGDIQAALAIGDDSLRKGIHRLHRDGKIAQVTWGEWRLA